MYFAAFCVMNEIGILYMLNYFCVYAHYAKLNKYFF